MVELSFHLEFNKKYLKIKDKSLKEKIYKQVAKIIKTPEIGKPMKHSRKGTRTVYISPFRLSYCFLKEKNEIIILDIYHKNKQ